MNGISKERLLKILPLVISELEGTSMGYQGGYLKALHDIQSLLRCSNPTPASWGFDTPKLWYEALTKTNGKKRGGFAALSPERLREVSAHGKGGFKNKELASQAGKKERRKC